MRFSKQTIQSLLRKDAGDLSTDEVGYVKSNEFMYNLACETWYFIVAEKDEAAAELLYDLIVRDGLVPTIATAQEQATALIKGSSMNSAWKFITKTCSTQEALQVLRYLKRFSPYKADVVESLSISSFKQVNNDLKMGQRYGYPQYLIKPLRWIVYSMLGANPGDIGDEVSWIDNHSAIDWVSAELDGYFSSGAVAAIEGDTSLATKLHEWKMPYYIDTMYPIKETFVPDWHDYPYANGDHPGVGSNKPYNAYLYALKTADVHAVPKNYKAARIIAKEEVTRQWYLQGINKQIRRVLRFAGLDELIPLENQEVNRRKCYEGSLDNRLATIDSSAASDHVSVSLFREIFPRDVVDHVMRYRSCYIKYPNGKVDLAQMIATSGSGVCFVLESIVFEAIALLATTDSMWYNNITSECEVPDVWAEDCAREVLSAKDTVSYGDDVVIPSFAADLFIEYMERLGFVINVEKSFFHDEFYREACGVEFYHGVELTTNYFPRKSLRRNADSLESLLSLNLKLFKYTKVHSLLKEVCKTIVPAKKWTTSSFDEYIEGECTDFVDYVGTEKVAAVPIGPAHRVVQNGKVTYKGPSVAVNYPTYEHFVVQEKVKKPSPYSVPEIYYYVEFLKNGPRYDDPLSELLGVSSPIRGIHDCSATTAPIIRTVRE